MRTVPTILLMGLVIGALGTAAVQAGEPRWDRPSSQAPGNDREGRIGNKARDLLSHRLENMRRKLAALSARVDHLIETQRSSKTPAPILEPLLTVIAVGALLVAAMALIMRRRPAPIRSNVQG